MRVIIEVPQEVLEHPHNYCCYALANQIEGKYTPIPDNVTNGDIIETMFPYINDKPNRVQDNGDMIVIYIDMGFGWRAIKFEKDWWNAPYRQEVQTNG